ncbi:MAG: alkaline phosphatase family protein [Candidatus Brocadiia bacterium]|jgi:predicted AlkP superfamily phosphohydrolase/phosphomutase
MRRRSLRVKLMLAILLMAFLGAPSAFAYIDPGTAQQVWSTLGPVIGIIIGCVSAVFLVFWAVVLRVTGYWRKFPVIKGMKGRTVALIAVACGLIVLGLGLVEHRGRASVALATKGSEVAYKRVIVIGIDGLDPRLVERMMDDGRMPNFAKLAREGTFSALQTAIPPESPVAWMSAATGMNPGRHGLFDFIRRNPENYLPDLSILKTSSKGSWRRSGQPYVPPSAQKAFWDILGEQGIPTVVLRWPVTFPAQPVNGRLLSGLGTPDVTGSLGRYAFVTTASLAADDKAPDRVVEVKWNGSAIQTELPGPLVMAFTGQKTSAVPLSIERVPGQQKITLRCGKNDPLDLAPGQWSDYISISFPGGLSRDCPAMVRFYLTSLEPELKLYVTAPQIDPKSPAFPISHPPGGAGELARAIGSFSTLGMPEDTQAVLHGRIPPAAFLQLCDRLTTEREAMFDQELKKFDKGLLAVVFDTSDRIEHMYWEDDDAAHTRPVTEPSSAPAIIEHYKRMDAVLGKALAKVDKDTAIFVLSDHGFTSFIRAVHLNRWLIQNGFMHLKDSDDAEGAPLLKNVDWSRTKAYAVGFCSLYLNLAGRDGQGIVKPGEEARQLQDELVQKLRAWNDPETGKPVVRNVYRKEDVYKGECVEEAPDLIMGYHPGYRGSWQTAVGAGPAGVAVVANNESWAGDHLVDAPCVPGTFLTNVHCTSQSLSLVDIAPTILRAFNVPLPEGLDGKPLF